ncbi:MAG: hypothetical protein ACRDM1_12710 [Gaiellaceae bacterium]
MSVDMRLLGYWKQQQSARSSARQALPERWAADPRPEMHAVNDAYVELLARVKQQNVHRLIPDDR